MRDRVQGSENTNVTAVPGPPAMRSRRAAVQPGSSPVQLQRPSACRAPVRDALDAALRGVRLGGRDRNFLRRLVHWDKRNAAAVASLLWRARQAGRIEASLSGRQLEVVLTALEDAGVYRNSPAAAAQIMPRTPTGHARAPNWPRSSRPLRSRAPAGRATSSARPASPASGAARRWPRDAG